MKYRVTLMGRGHVVFEVDAVSVEAAKDEAYDLYDRGFGEVEMDDVDRDAVKLIGPSDEPEESADAEAQKSSR